MTQKQRPPERESGDIQDAQLRCSNRIPPPFASCQAGPGGFAPLRPAYREDKALILANVPEALRTTACWVRWRLALRGKRWTKVPIQPNGAPASSTDFETWATFDACAASRVGDGIGRVFDPDEGWLGIDIDKCLNPNRTVKPWAVPILASLGDAYGEVSPSGTGLKFWRQVDEFPFAEGGRRQKVKDAQGNVLGEVEIYIRGRYFTTTGDRWHG